MQRYAQSSTDVSTWAHNQMIVYDYNEEGVYFILFSMLKGGIMHVSKRLFKTTLTRNFLGKTWFVTHWVWLFYWCKNENFVLMTQISKNFIDTIVCLDFITHA